MSEVRIDLVRPVTAVPRPHQRRIVAAFWDWSEWCRQVMRGIQGYAHDKPDWRLYVFSGAKESSDIFRRHQNWDGILTHVLYEVSAVRRLMREGHTQIVSFSATLPRALKNIPAVRVNDDVVAETIGRHLLAGGFRQFAYFNVRGTVSRLDYRALAVQRFAASVGCPCHLTEQGAGSMPTARSLAAWARKLPKPIGIFAWNMDQARRVVQACQRAGLVVPDDAAVVAWDDDDLLAENMDPSISGAVLPAQRLGHEAARLLDGLLSGQTPPVQPVLVEPAEILHVRQSSDAATIPDRPVYLAAQYIREHAAEPLAVSDVASYLRISRRGLERQFLRVSGQTVNAAIMTAHLERARQLLLETSWPLERIATRSGFGTTRHFYRVFTASMKTSPAEYRQRFSV